MRWTASTKRLAAVSLGLAVVSGATRAQADQIAVAHELFEQAKELMADGKVSEACRAFAQSMKLDPGTGTLLNLAVCHEKEGKIATAWAEFSQVVPMARNQGRADRVQLAQERTDALATKLSYLTLDVPKESAVHGLTIRVDGSEIDDLLWGKGLAEDGGPHVVEASAKGKKTWTTTVEMAPESDKQSVTVPLLEDAPVEPVVSPQKQVDVMAVADALAAARARRMIGFALGGAGIATLGVGVVFGALAISANSAAKQACPQDPLPCPNAAAANAKNSDAVDDAKVANVTVVVGLLAVAGGAALVLTGLPPKSTAAPSSARNTLRVTPAPLPGGGAMFLGGAW
jgi:hypothetical protein